MCEEHWGRYLQHHKEEVSHLYNIVSEKKMMRPKVKIAPEVRSGPANNKGPPNKPPPKELVSAAKATSGQKKAPPPVSYLSWVYL